MQVCSLTLIDFLCDLGPTHLQFDDLVVELGGKDLIGSKLRCSIFQHLNAVTGETAPKKGLVCCIFKSVCNLEMKPAA